MDCKARGRRCPEAGKDPVAVEAVEAAVAPGRGSGHGRRELREGRSFERGQGAPVDAPRAGAEVGEAGSLEWGLRPEHPGLQGPRREAERGEGVLNRTPASASLTHARLEPRG